MERYNELRWKRLLELELPFKNIKSIVRKKYKYEIKENNLVEFYKSISKYNDIIQEDLLNMIEQYSYKKISIFYGRQYRKNKKEPIFEELQNEIFQNCFKMDNGINMNNGEYYNGELGCCFKITYFNQIDNRFIIIKMAKVINMQVNIENENGEVDEKFQDKYDFVKFVLDLDKKLIFMFYNDFIGMFFSYEKEVTSKKTAFRNLFTNVSKQALLKYNIDNKLELYFKEYMKEIKDGNPHKLISIIETINFNEIKSSLKSIAHDYNHNRKRLDAIENEVNNEGHTISNIECKVNGNTININNVGEIICENNFFDREVVEDVFKEFFNGYQLSTYI